VFGRDQELKKSGATTMKGACSPWQALRWPSLSSSPFGQGKDRGTFYASPGTPTTDISFVFDNRRPGAGGLD
jgi:hypothetical protein